MTKFLLIHPVGDAIDDSITLAVLGNLHFSVVV